MEKGIKEILEVFDGLDVIAETAGQIMENDKVGPEDIAALVSMATKFGTLQEAVKGVKEAMEEGKDLDQAEVMQILTRIYGVVDKFAKAKKG